MKLSENTLEVLKNFASINANMVFNEGSTLKTMSVAKSILASAEITETFSTEFGIYDLNEFLSVLGLFEDPDIDLSDDGKVITLSQGKNRAKYYTSDPSMLAAPSKMITLPSSELEFTLTNEQLAKFRKAAGTFKAPNLVFENVDGELIASVTDISNSSSNSWQEVIPTDSDLTDEFRLVYDIANFKMLPGDYDVRISNKKLSEFKSDTATYFVVLHKDSKFGE